MSRKAAGVLYLLLLGLCLVPAACVRPDSVEIFVPAAKAADGVYIFDFEMADSLATYDISFFTRNDGNVLDSLPLKVMWLSPSGESLSETVYMDPLKVTEKYRSGVRPDECGSWRLCVRPVVEGKGFRGLGIICKENGTR